LHGCELRVEARLLLPEVVSAERRSRDERESEYEEDDEASGHRHESGSSGRSASLPARGTLRCGAAGVRAPLGMGSGTGAGTGGSPSSGGGYGSGFGGTTRVCSVAS